MSHNDSASELEKLRAEVTLFKADAQRRRNMALLAAISLVCVFVALVFLNAGVFFVLTETAIDSRAALILAAANFILVGIPFMSTCRSMPVAHSARSTIVSTIQASGLA